MLTSSLSFVLEEVNKDQVEQTSYISARLRYRHLLDLTMLSIHSSKYDKMPVFSHFPTLLGLTLGYLIMTAFCHPPVSACKLVSDG